MFRQLKLFIGLNASASSRRLLNGKSPRPRREIQFEPPAIMDTVHEVAIYVHRFHNLDLFQQGWYQIKISMRWEDSRRDTPGTPARVVQYEAPGLASDGVMGIWRINDADHSFSTQPFRIKYARQDVLLSVMVSFNLAVGRNEILSTSGIILRFELMYTPMLANGFEMQASIDTPAAVHEFRIPPKALLGFHSYCPVHFDSFHAVLVDLSIHTVLLKVGTYTSSQKVPSASHEGEDVVNEHYDGYDELLGQGVIMGSRAIDRIKSLSNARNMLLEELQNISKAIGQTIDDLADAVSNLGRHKLIDADAKSSGIRMGGGQLAGRTLSSLERSNGTVDVGNDVMLKSMSKEDLLDTFHSVGNQLSSLWNTFLKFHRSNRTRILEYLRDAWANDRKAEWSIWMVHSKIEIPHRYLRSGADGSPHNSVIGKVSVPRKSSDDPAQTATTRAELHRRSISQMKINNRSIQDMHIFGDPSHVPVVLVEQHVMNIPMRASSYDSSTGSLDQKPAIHMGPGDKVLPKLFGGAPQRNSRILKAVVFVHGFQGHHLDLRLVRNQWLLLDPAAECLMSEANEEKTSGDFREMGSRLAEEVNSFLRKKMDKFSRSGGCRDIKLSFVGHSIGNIIIRSALTESVMEPFLRHLHTYMSLSGPHLGYWYSSNSLFNSGLWLLKKLKGAQCIHQLTFTDDPVLQNTFFYQLCKRKTLEDFKNIMLLSSPQDGYVPYHSARIELCQASSLDYSKKAHVFMEMLNHCLDQIRAPTSERRTFMRCDVNFDTSSQGKNFNTIIGRAAHIEFLETDIFARFIMWSFPELFR